MCQYIEMTSTKKKVPLFSSKDCCSIRDAPLTEKVAQELALSFTALSDPVRLRLLSLIATGENGEVCGCELAEPLGKSQPTLSHHLKILFEAGLVTREKRGVWVWYAVASDKVDLLKKALE